jgi:Uma2 family endonuclease
MTLTRTPTREKHSPAWDIALIYPEQGQWSENDYLAVTETTNRLVELRDGSIEVLTMPTSAHQRIVGFLNQLLLAFLARNPLGEVLFAPLRVRLWDKTFREPDLVFMLAKHAKRAGEDYWDGADLVMEVVSGTAEDRQRDLVSKRRDYARAGIDEYWIVDPKEKRLTVLRRRARSYAVHAEVVGTGIVTSALLSGFEVDAALVFGAGKRR